MLAKCRDEVDWGEEKSERNQEWHIVYGHLQTVTGEHVVARWLAMKVR